MIKEFEFKNFMGHSAFAQPEVGMVNVFIGKNDTGKSGILKLLYSALKGVEEYELRRKNEPVNFKKVLAEKLLNTFEPGKKGLGELVNKHNKDKLGFKCSFSYSKASETNLCFSFQDSTVSTIYDIDFDDQHDNQVVTTIFLPPKEVFTSSDAILVSSDVLHLKGFDDTYIDLIRMLNINPKKKIVKGQLVNITQSINQLFNGSIQKNDNNQFVFQKGKMDIPIGLAAEGIKKIGAISRLINNNQLKPGSVLFIDEPENTLHPAAILKVAEIVVLLAQVGIQVFIATHSLFMIKQLEILARRESIMIPLTAIETKGSELIYETYDLQEGLRRSSILDALDELAIQEFNLAD
jgi:predicted ATPase